MRKQFILAAVGDLAPSRNLTDCKSNVNHIWNYFRKTDFVVANLENPLTNSVVKTDKAATIKGDPAIAPSLSEVGIDLVTVANNHAMDFGVEGLAETIKVVNESDVLTVGGGMDLESASRPEYVEIEGLRIAVFGFTSSVPTGYAAGPNRPGVAPIRAHSRFFIDNMTLDEQPGISPWVETKVNQNDMEYACRRVAEARKETDFVIVNMHWGIPNGWCAAFQGPLADYQQPLAHALIDAGADVIVGHHPHTIHGIDKYKHGLIAYSLGNFLFHGMGEDMGLKLTIAYPPYKFDSISQGEARESLIMEIVLEDKKMKEVRFLPIILNSQGDPEFLNQASAEKVIKRLERLSKDFQVKIEIKHSVGILTP
jgi:poly-gamma-glutamate synthesis protein (capsule biosynthesis protein)